MTKKIIFFIVILLTWTAPESRHLPSEFASRGGQRDQSSRNDTSAGVKRFVPGLWLLERSQRIWQEEEENSQHDLQRVRLAGLALSQLNQAQLASEEPPLCNAGPHPGTTYGGATRQAGLYPADESSQDMLVEAVTGLLLLIWRPETQKLSFSPVPSYTWRRFLQRPLCPSKGPQSSKTPLKCQFFRGAVRLCHAHQE
ncbi:hypothetical protein TNCV_4476571 [Trichonephila clavipes]|nr:hypothetical protein TNCV_4476571 [Trichonephila clavipes]